MNLLRDGDLLKCAGSLRAWKTGEDKEISVVEEGGHFSLWGYEILSCPLISENLEQGKELIAKLHQQQKVLLDTLRTSFLSQLQSAVELRFVKVPSSDITRIVLVFRVFTPSESSADGHELKNVIRSILPGNEYEFAALSAEELIDLLDIPFDSQINLLRKRLSLVQVGSMKPFKTGFMPWVGAEFPEAPGLNQSAGTSADKRSPERFYSVPGVDYLNWHEGNWRYVFQVLQGSGHPVVLRVAFFTANVFSQEQALADQYVRFLTTHYAAYSYPKSSYAAYLESLSKYTRRNSICACQIMVASPDATVRNALSSAVASEVSYGNQGTLQSFPARVTSEEEAASFHDDWLLCRERVNSGLAELDEIEKVEGRAVVHEKVRSFVLRAPFLFDEVEAGLLFRLPVGEGLLGIRCIPPRPFYPPNPPRPSASERPDDEDDLRQIPLGRVVNGYQQGQFHKIGVKQFSGHACAFGMTGAGKSNATHDIIYNLATLESPVRFTVFEPTLSEYFVNLKNLGLPVKRFHLDSPWRQTRPYGKFADPDFLRLNPLAIPGGIKMIRHCSLIKSCIMAAWPLYGIMPVVLENALINAYRSKGWDLFDDGRAGKPVPTIIDLKDEIERYINDGTKFQHQETKQQLQDAFVRRFENLLESSALGYCLSEDKWTDRGRTERAADSSLDTLLNHSCVVELESLADDGEKALMMAFLLSLIYEHYQASGKSRALRHILIMEESHRLLSSSSFSPRTGGEGGSQTQDSRSKAIQLFLDMLAESRKLGLGLLCVDQLPTALRPEVVKQANLKIMLRLAAEDDRTFLGESMGLDKSQQANVTTLRQGDAIIFEQDIDNPIMVHFPKRI